ncbi:hypothetical protein OE749_18340 [Aestuariibacter sp. AA17]|uniref:Uncharacterized protein n=1 Tax=Fluctibacter corallii TaxID=2984329 RepID=A0ABT3ADD2_9ALTE|nr:hypothetical protein [Aestuariibacter sp. AA17]MCV2886659.1 hypothetical protein [Aestuariibacter sp. AA17]
MKTFKKLILFGIAAFVFTQNAQAADNHFFTDADVEQEITQSLHTALANIHANSVKQHIAYELNKMTLQFKTDALIAAAKAELTEPRAALELGE